jgi:hypothetical protein
MLGTREMVRRKQRAISRQHDRMVCVKLVVFLALIVSNPMRQGTMRLPHFDG